jgi:chitodextrinase
LILVNTAALTTNTWTHLAVTYDGTTLRFYVNGTQVSSQAITGNILTSNTPLQIGGDTFFNQYFAGMIDEVRVYNVALTATQIQSDMGTQIGVADTQAPTAPGSVTATAASGNQINLSWTASTDNVGVTNYLIESCQGAGCSTFTQIGTSATTTFSNTGLTAGTSYSYRVRATDAAANLGPYSNTATASTQASDTQNPTTPTSLTATAASGSQINLGWTASTDNVGVTGYLIERCQGVGCTSFGRITTAPGTTFSDTGLISNTSYTYQVKATDAAGNFSPYSNTATATSLNTISGLVAAFSFDEGSGTTVTDLSGTGNNGTTANTTWVTAGKFGKALSFNGSSSRVTIPDATSLHLATGVTLEAWVNPNVVTSGWRDVIYKGNDNYFLEGTTDHSGVPGGGVTVGTTDATIFGTATLPANTWSHIALTYDGANERFYLNGNQVSIVAQTGNIVTSTNPLTIGSDPIFGQFFSGMIDEVRVYNTALNQAQIQSDMGIPVGGGSIPLVNLNPTTVNFGNQQTGNTSAAVPVTLTNSGSAALTINAVTIAGGNTTDFAQTNNCVGTLGVGTSCTINVTFTPTTTGARSSSVSISDNAPGTPHSVSLLGTGAGFQVSPRVAVVTFGTTQQFSVTSGTPTWSVDGVAGGSATLGTISTSGVYVPPSAAGTHTITGTTSTQSANATVYVSNYPGTFTFHNDNLRSGLNSNELVLTPSNVNQSQFGKLFSYPLDGIAYASPLYVSNVNIPNVGTRNVVYIATEHDSVYAFDADGGSTLPLWQLSFLRSGVTTVPCADVGECGDIATELGITGTPVIDQSTGTLYVVAKTKEGSAYVQRLHALDIRTGAEKFGGPVVLQASVAGTGNGSVGGQVPFSTLRENQRPALALVNGVIYITFASHGDKQPWHGWVLGYNATTLAQTFAFCVSPDGYGGGIWQSGEGPASDASGGIFFTTGNGNFNVDTGGRDYGDTVVKLGPTGTVMDYFTPFDQASLESNNFDLSSAGPVLLVDQPGAHPHLLVAAAKGGTIYVVDRDNMGHFHSGSDNQIVQTITNALPHGGAEEGNYSSPVFFNNKVYFGAVNDTLKTFQFTNGVLSTSFTTQSAVTYPNRGASFAVSSSGTSNGILWAMQDNNPSNGVLRAYDANNLATELYNTNQAGPRDTFGLATKFSIPLVANGKVFIISQGQLVAYGLLP